MQSTNDLDNAREGINMIKFCPGCGAKIEHENVKFCMNCGQALDMFKTTSSGKENVSTQNDFFQKHL